MLFYLQWILSGWLAVALAFTMLWAVSVKARNAGYVDVGWAIGLGAWAIYAAVWTTGDIGRRVLIALLMSVWALRLAKHIASRLWAEREEDPRYSYLRNYWASRADQNFFIFFQAQALAVVLLGLPLIILMEKLPGFPGWWDALAVIWIIACLYGEHLADLQLKHWRGDPCNRGKTCRVGLWSWSRHPNYFFEWCYWLGYPLMGLSLWGTEHGAWWWLLLPGPFIMLWLLLKVTGIPYTEKRALKSRGDDYRKYQQEVSKFLPLPPKSALR
jgi:steroid 5-alpha reductase family enzyme